MEAHLADFTGVWGTGDGDNYKQHPWSAASDAGLMLAGPQPPDCPLQKYEASVPTHISLSSRRMDPSS